MMENAQNDNNWDLEKMLEEARKGNRDGQSFLIDIELTQILDTLDAIAVRMMEGMDENDIAFVACKIAEGGDIEEMRKKIQGARFTLRECLRCFELHYPPKT